MKNLRLFVIGGLLSGVATSYPLPAQVPTSGATRDVFDVATIKPADQDPKGGRYLTMQGPHRFVAKNFTLKLLVAAAYDLNARTISGGPAWIETQHFDIEAITPGEAKPDRRQQMSMLRSLLADRFQMKFHREQKQFSIYELAVETGGPKLSLSKAPPE